MSKISLTPDASGTGTFTLASPNSNTNRTLTLPDAAGELLTTTGDGSGLTSLTSANLTGALPAISGAALTGIESLIKAAVNFDGYLSVTVNSSTNVASVVRNAVGDYTVTFTTAMPNTNYLWFVLVPDRPGASAGFGSGVNNLTTTKSVGSIRFKTGYTGNSANTDGADISVLIISL
jgi:hypothetical protein